VEPSPPGLRPAGQIRRADRYAARGKGLWLRAVWTERAGLPDDERGAFMSRSWERSPDSFEGARHLTREEARKTRLPQDILVQVDSASGRITFWQERSDGHLIAPPLGAVPALRAKQVLRDLWDS